MTAPASEPNAVPAAPESRWIPTHTELPAGSRILVVAPHPDDESLGCGGTIVRHQRRGDAVTIVFLTDGRAADSAKQFATEAYVSMREREAVNALRILGVADYVFWRVPDRNLRADDETILRFRELISRIKPDLIYVPSFFEFHTDHVAAAGIAWAAVGLGNPRVRLAFYEINHPFRINTLVDITPVVEEKKKACDEYASQLAVIPYTELALSLNRFRSLTVSHTARYAEGFFVVEPEQAGVGPLESFALRYMTMRDKVVADDAPLVTVIVRTRDRPQLLRDALWSISAQTYPRIETVVVQDGGSDVSQVIEEFAARLDIRFTKLTDAPNRSRAGNAGLAMARGEYAMFLDDDDVLYSNHVSTLAGFLRTTGRSVAYTDCTRIIRLDGSKVPSEVLSPYLGFDFDRDRLLEENFIPLMTVMFKRELATSCGGFDESSEIFEDWDLWIRMSAETDFVRIPRITAEYRIFSERKIDVHAARRRVYEKNRGYWTFERLYESAWSRIERLENEQRRLLDVIHGRRIDRVAARVRAAWRELKR